MQFPNFSQVSAEIKMRNGRLRYVIYAGAILTLFSLWLTCSAKREAAQHSVEQTNNLRENFKTFVSPLSEKVDAVSRENDSLKKVVEQIQTDLNFFYPPVKPEAKPTRWDTSEIFEQKSLEEK